MDSDKNPIPVTVPITQEQLHRARLAVLRLSRTREDAAELLQVLGISNPVRIQVDG